MNKEKLKQKILDRFEELDEENLGRFLRSFLEDRFKAANKLPESFSSIYEDFRLPLPEPTPETIEYGEKLAAIESLSVDEAMEKILASAEIKDLLAHIGKDLEVLAVQVPTAEKDIPF